MFNGVPKVLIFQHIAHFHSTSTSNHILFENSFVRLYSPPDHFDNAVAHLLHIQSYNN